jgi:hypothetical protein
VAAAGLAAAVPLGVAVREDAAPGSPVPPGEVAGRGVAPVVPVGRQVVQAVAALVQAAAAVCLGAPLVVPVPLVVPAGPQVVRGVTGPVRAATAVLGAVTRHGAPPVALAGLPVVRAGLPVVRAGLPVVRAGLPVVRAGLPVVRAGLPVVRAAARRGVPPVVRVGLWLVRGVTLLVGVAGVLAGPGETRVGPGPAMPEAAVPAQAARNATAALADAMR